MIDAKQARTWDVGLPALDLIGWLQAALCSLSARFGSWRSDEGENELLGAADPELVAALQLIASVLASEPTERPG